MPNTPSITENIRRLAHSVLVELGAKNDGRKLRETMLIRNGNYCGHRYRLGDFEAVWFIEEDELKFSSSADGTIRSMIASAAITELGTRRTQKAA
jgi:hypothetical protein